MVWTLHDSYVGFLSCALHGPCTITFDESCRHTCIDPDRIMAITLPRSCQGYLTGFQYMCDILKGLVELV